MKVTSKGQVTIPLEIRKKMGIDETTEVDFFEKNGQVYLAKSKEAKGKSSKIASLRGVATVRLSTDQILALTR